VIAAPVAAWFTRHVPPRPMGLAVAALLLATNTQQLADWASLGAQRWLAYVLVAMLVAAAALAPKARRRMLV